MCFCVLKVKIVSHLDRLRRVPINTLRARVVQSQLLFLSRSSQLIGRHVQTGHSTFKSGRVAVKNRIDYTMGRVCPSCRTKLPRPGCKFVKISVSGWSKIPVSSDQVVKLFKITEWSQAVQDQIITEICQDIW